MTRATPGYKGALYSTGDPVVFTEEAATVDGDIATINDPSLSIFDGKTEVEVFEDGITVDPTTYNVRYLAGQIVFTGPVPTGVVTISGSYLPRLKLSGIVSGSFDMSTEDIDSTDFDDEFYQSVSGKGQSEGSFTTIALGDSEDFITDLEERERLIVDHEIKSGVHYRAVIRLDEASVSADEDGRVEIEISYQSKNPPGLSGGQVGHVIFKG